MTFVGTSRNIAPKIGGAAPRPSTTFLEGYEAARDRIEIIESSMARSNSFGERREENDKIFEEITGMKVNRRDFDSSDGRRTVASIGSKRFFNMDQLDAEMSRMIRDLPEDQRARLKTREQILKR